MSMTDRQLNRIEALVANAYALLADVRDLILDNSDATQASVQQLGETMATDFSNIQTEVGEISDAVDAGVTLLDDLATRLRDVQTDDPAVQAQLDELAGQLDAQGRALMEAVVRDAPADPAAGGGTTEPPAGGGDTGGGDTGGTTEPTLPGTEPTTGGGTETGAGGEGF